MSHRIPRAVARATGPVVLAALLGLAAGAATAQAVDAGVATSSEADGFTEGEVRKVDRDAGRLTLRHGPLRNLDMPGMTMVFDVADAAVLERLRPGERVRFQADRVDGRFVVTRIESSPSPSPSPSR